MRITKTFHHKNQYVSKRVPPQKWIRRHDVYQVYISPAEQATLAIIQMEP